MWLRSSSATQTGIVQGGLQWVINSLTRELMLFLTGQPPPPHHRVEMSNHLSHEVQGNSINHLSREEQGNSIFSTPDTSI